MGVPSALHVPTSPTGPRLPEQSEAADDTDPPRLQLRFVTESPPAVLTCLVFFFPKFLIYMSYSFTGGRSKRENVKEKSRSMSRSSLVLRTLQNKVGTRQGQAD